MGVGMTTHSHKVGLFQESVISYDVILANGKLIHVTKDNEHSDLHQALPWSHGTLGLLVALELEIIPAKPYIHMNYIPMRGKKRYCTLLRELAGANNKDKHTPDFLEAIIYSKEEAVILAGWFSNATDRLKVNHVKKWYKPWFYKYVETFLKRGNTEELIPLEDYLLRHNRSIFWVMESMLPFGNNELFRLFFGWLLPPKIAFLKFTTTPGIRKLTFTKQVFQDIVLPMSSLEEQIDLSQELFDLYPLLVYPCRVYDRGELSGQIPTPNPDCLCPGADYALYNDLGIYGVPGYVKRKLEYNSTQAMRKMEAFTRSIRGFSFLYADIFMTREEFEQMFDLKLYDQVRKKYSAEGAFPHLYDKVKPEIDVIAIGENSSVND
ncbi:delta(24)-sterol reductase-like [Macrosteles quadrilineatus]|uniref:delta(24)-sterol reductase-like n=1 Tax=Macrosteles quadrilineatus TaxID=74068 RepID=UPI0023E25E5C|nr:delta(24)-sterol reductase-like [Macrosteles quadrilineatus]